MKQYLDMVFPPMPLRHLPLPGIEELQAAAKLASDSAPGPDGLPFRAWVRSDGSIEILHALLHSVAHGGPIPHDLNCALTAMLPKGNEPMGNYECPRSPDCLRPLAMKSSDIKIIASAANRILSSVASNTEEEQQGF
eukprot:5024835-Pyramimonas_sp.AAC.1